MGVELHADPVRFGADVRRGSAFVDQTRDGVEVLGRQHVAVREGQTEDGIVRKGRPVVELRD